MVIGDIDQNEQLRFMLSQPQLLDAVSTESPLIRGLDVYARRIDHPVVNFFIRRSQSWTGDIIVRILPLIAPPLKMSIHPFALVFDVFVDLRRCQVGFGVEPRAEFMKEFGLRY